MLAGLARRLPATRRAGPGVVDLCCTPRRARRSAFELLLELLLLREEIRRATQHSLSGAVCLRRTYGVPRDDGSDWRAGYGASSCAPAQDLSRTQTQASVRSPGAGG